MKTITQELIERMTQEAGSRLSIMEQVKKFEANNRERGINYTHTLALGFMMENCTHLELDEETIGQTVELKEKFNAIIEESKKPKLSEKLFKKITRL